MKTKQTIKQRNGKTMVTVTVKTEPAIIDFADILEATRLEPDDFGEAPWENSDGFEHEVVDDETDGEAAGSFRDDRGRRKRVKTDQFEDWGSAPRGASKQVVFEHHAREVKRTVEQIAKWYSQGWEVWVAVCEFMGKRDSLCGIYAEVGDEHAEDCREQVALEVAAQLEKDGYEVVNYPKQSDVSMTQRRLDYSRLALATY